MRCVTLTYHSNNVIGHSYDTNDHVALERDIEFLAELEVPIMPLQAAVDALLSNTTRQLPDRFVALSCDDGSWFDWYDLEHPTLGTQRSFANILADAAFARPNVPLHLTSFVIVSPLARAELDRTCLINRGWWGEDWWQRALDSGRMAIENHSWDHHHETLSATATGLPGGSFVNVDNYAAADVEIRQASNYLDAKLPSRRTRLFAYPYGSACDYLADEYLPRYGNEHRLDAAFTTDPEPITRESNRWRLGRYVCGQDWRSTAELWGILRDAFGVG